MTAFPKADVRTESKLLIVNVRFGEKNRRSHELRCRSLMDRKRQSTAVSSEGAYPIPQRPPAGLSQYRIGIGIGLNVA